MTESFSDILPVEALRERDMDVLILEEIKCNPVFRKWFLEKTIGQIDNYEFLGVWHSLTQISLGEIDITFLIKNDKEKTLFLLENKIDADFQPDQADRYRLMGQQRKDEGHCDNFFTVLIAPQKYIVRNNDFNFYIEYEELRSWFIDKSELGDRAKYKADILSIAIEKLRRGYSAIIHEGATAFWKTYFQFATKNYPHLKMRKPPDGVPKSSDFIMFEPTDIGLNKRDQIIHKGYGAVDLQLFGKADQLQIIIDKYSNTLTDEMKIVKAKNLLQLELPLTSLTRQTIFTIN